MGMMPLLSYRFGGGMAKSQTQPERASALNGLMAATEPKKKTQQLCMDSQ